MLHDGAMYERIAGRRTPESAWEWISPALKMDWRNLSLAKAMMESYALDNVVAYGTCMFIVRAPTLESFELADLEELGRVADSCLSGE